MNALDWDFTDPEQYNGRWRVRGRYRKLRNYYSEPTSDRIGFDWAGMLIGPVTGEGDTPEAARMDAAYRAGVFDEERRKTMYDAQVAIMRGRWPKD